jgi:hypothetical protein
MRLGGNQKAEPSRGEGRERTGGRAATEPQTRCWRGPKEADHSDHGATEPRLCSPWLGGPHTPSSVKQFKNWNIWPPHLGNENRACCSCSCSSGLRLLLLLRAPRPLLPIASSSSGARCAFVFAPLCKAAGLVPPAVLGGEIFSALLLFYIARLHALGSAECKILYMLASVSQCNGFAAGPLRTT